MSVCLRHTSLEGEFAAVSATGSHALLAMCVPFNSLTTDLEVLAIYEYIITAGDEINIVWRRKFNISSSFLLSVRWIMVINAVVQIYPTTEKVSLQLCLVMVSGIIEVGYNFRQK